MALQSLEALPTHQADQMTGDDRLPHVDRRLPIGRKTFCGRSGRCKSLVDSLDQRGQLFGGRAVVAGIAGHHVGGQVE